MKPMQNPKPIPVTLEFKEMRAYAWLHIAAAFDLINNPMEYFIAPAGAYNPKTKQWDIEGYSFVHISHLPPTKEYLNTLRTVERGTQKND